MKRSAVVSIIGRPNVGKSTIFNRLMRQAKLAMTHDQPEAIPRYMCTLPVAPLLPVSMVADMRPSVVSPKTSCVFSMLWRFSKTFCALISEGDSFTSASVSPKSLSSMSARAPIVQPMHSKQSNNYINDDSFVTNTR